MSVDSRAARLALAPLEGLRRLSAEFPRVVLVLAAGDLVASFGFSLFFPFLTIYLVQQLGASAAQAGLVVAAYSLCSIGSGVAGGWLADRLGRRPVLIVSSASTALLVTSMALVTEAWHVGLVMLLLGSIDPAFLPAARAAVADAVDEDRRPRAYGLLGVANALGWIAGPVIGAGLSTLGYPLLFGVSGILVGCYSLIALRWLPETRPARGGVARDGGRAGAAVGAATSPEPKDTPPGRAAAGSMPRGHSPKPGDGRPTGEGSSRTRDGQEADGLRVRVFGWFLPLVAVTHAVTFLWVTTLPIDAARGLGVPTTVWGILFGLNGLLIVLFQLRVSTATERRSKPRVIAVAVASYALGFALASTLTPATAIAGLAGTIALVTIGEMLLMPVVPAFISELSPSHRRGTYQGIALAASGIGSGLGPPLAGLVLDAAPGRVVWLGSASILVAVCAGFLVLARSADRLAIEGEASSGTGSIGAAPDPWPGGVR